MSSGSGQPCIKLRSPIDALTARVLRAVEQAARTMGCEHFLAGATARDLLLTNIHGLAPGRATRDIDFGIAVGSWDDFHRLKQQLITTGCFRAVPRREQRLMYQGEALRPEMPVDLIPYGGVASADGSIAWPADDSVVMNVTGFEDAARSSLAVLVEDSLVARVVSLPGLALLKVLAWADRRHSGTKDAPDFLRLLSTYHEAGNTDRLYDQEVDLLEQVGFDVEQAGAHLLGRDVVRICSEPVTRRVERLLNSESLRDQLADEMVRARANAEAAEAVRRLLDNFHSGFSQRPE